MEKKSLLEDDIQKIFDEVVFTMKPSFQDIADMIDAIRQKILNKELTREKVRDAARQMVEWSQKYFVEDAVIRVSSEKLYEEVMKEDVGG